VHVPMVLRSAERIPAGREVHEVVRLVDVLPTLVELAGFEPPAVSGRSLLPCLRGEEPWPSSAWSEQASGDRRSVGLRTRQWKYIVGPKGEEAYHLSSDPGEREDRLGDIPEELRRRVGEYLATPVHNSGTVEFDEDQRKQLLRLGYLIEDEEP